MQLLELGYPRRLKQIDARRKQLAELDERGSQLFKSKTNAHCRLERERFRFRAPAQYLSGAFQHSGDAAAAYNVTQPVTNQYRRNLMQTRQIPHRI